MPWEVVQDHQTEILSHSRHNHLLGDLLAQCVNVSLTLLLRYRYTPEAGGELKIPPIVWLNGNLVYFSGKHLVYALPVLFCLITIGILPQIFLLSYPLLNKLCDSTKNSHRVYHSL